MWNQHVSFLFETGRSICRIKSTDSNVQYSSGSYRLDVEVSNGDSDRVILNSYHKDTNHQKWHRNHPKDGFYQKREEFPFE
ncbi:hypothetical protein ABK040_002574 [Willaertia magna]